MSAESETTPPRPRGRVAAGHPVDVASGTFFTAWNDIEIGGMAPIVLRRYFSASLEQESLAGLGPGWTHNFALTLSRTAAGFQLRDPSGSFVDFDLATRTSLGSVFNHPAAMELRVEGDFLCVYHWHDWKTGIEKLWFRGMPRGQFRFEQVSTPAGNGLVLDHDDAGRLASVKQMIEGRSIRFEHDGLGRIQSLSVGSRASGERQFCSYAYDAAGRLVSVTDALGLPIHYEYDGAGKMMTETTRGGATYRMRYDSSGRCVSTRCDDGHHATRLQYLLDGKLTIVTDSLGHATAYECNASGQVIKESRPDGAVIESLYDGEGRIVEEVDALGRSTRYRYDASGNTGQIVYPSGFKSAFEYDADHQPTQLRLGSSTWKLAYHRGSLTSVVDPRGIARHYEYDGSGVLTAVIEPNGNKVRIEADESWSYVRIGDDVGVDHEAWFDDLMNMTRRSDPGGASWAFGSDAAGRLVRVVGPDGGAKDFTYDAGGILTSMTDEDGHTARFRSNRHGLLEQATTPDGRVSTFAWDTEGRLKTWTNPASEAATFVRDAVGRAIEICHFDGRVEAFEFDQAGRAKSRRRADGSTLDFAYDARDNLQSVSSGGIALINNTYDDEGRLISTRTPDAEVAFTYGIGEWITGEVQGDWRIDYAYDRSGALASRALSGSPLPPLQFEWDLRLRLSALRRGGRAVETFTYDVGDRQVERHFAGCTIRQTFDIAGRLAGQRVERDGDIVSARTWLHDGRGNVHGIDDSRTGSTRYGFDGDHLLASSVTPDRETVYAYDANGNLLSTTPPGQPSAGDGRKIGAGNALISSGSRRYERDALGHVILIDDRGSQTRLVWDTLGQLREAWLPDGSHATYAYDGLGRRTKASDANGTTRFVWSGQQLLAEIGPDGVMQEYFSCSFDIGTVWRDTRVLHVLNSHHGVPLDGIDAEGRLAWTQRLDDWGRRIEGGTPRDAEIDLPMRFRGQYADSATGMHYNRFRYYDPVAAQYLSPDPLGLVAGPNEFAYGVNPINWSDPHGLSCNTNPGDHTVYVLEKGPPPTPPKVVYVGITVQSPHDRLSQHKNDPPGGGGKTPPLPFDRMRIVASGPPAVPDRTASRLIESSMLANHPVQPQGGGAAQKPSGALLNAARPTNPGYYHSNIPSASPAGTTHLPASTTGGQGYMTPAPGQPIIYPPP
jgi:RHS repeat-associated protein